MEGKIIVNRVLVSCYAAFNAPDVSHFSMAPLRWIPEMIEEMFGHDEKFPVFVTMGHELGTWLFSYEKFCS